MNIRSIKGRSVIICIVLAIMVSGNVILSFRGNLNIRKINHIAFPAYKYSKQMSLHLIEVWQYLSDISATRGLDNLDDGFKEAESSSQKFKENISELENLLPEKKDDLENISIAFDDFYSQGKNMANAYIKDGPKEGNKLMPNFDKSADKILELTNKFSIESDSSINLAMNTVSDQLNISLYNLIFSGTIVFIAVIGFFAQINKLLSTISTFANKVAEGDLSNNLDIKKTKDEIGNLANAFEICVMSLKEIINKIKISVKTVKSASEQISSSINETAKASEHVAVSIQNIAIKTNDQSEDVKNISKLMNGLDNNFEEIVHRLNQTAKAAENSEKISRAGADLIENMNSNMTLIFENNNRNINRIRDLEKNSKEISEIIGVITSIASQTNLLALNAAIESARAGEYGRGFSIVAEEVRKLAEESNISAQRISNLITHIQNNIEEITEGIIGGTENIECGRRVSNEIMRKFNNIKENENNTLRSVNELVNSSTETKDISNNVNSLLTDIKQMIEDSAMDIEAVTSSTEEHSANAKAIEVPVTELIELTNELSRLVEHFKIA